MNVMNYLCGAESEEFCLRRCEGILLHMALPPNNYITNSVGIVMSWSSKYAYIILIKL